MLPFTAEDVRQNVSKSAYQNGSVYQSSNRVWNVAIDAFYASQKVF